VVEDRRAAFCARLKAAREQKGVALEQIAAATKVARSLLKGLEENDLSRWPQGIYRRSYLRDYLRAVDLPEQPIVAEFVRLFPDGEAPCLELAVLPEPDQPCALSMTLADGPPERLARSRKHLLAAALDMAAVVILSGLAWWPMRADGWASAAVIPRSAPRSPQVFSGIPSMVLSLRSLRRVRQRCVPGMTLSRRPYGPSEHPSQTPCLRMRQA
jgi:cytoskeletal protein RodZ